MEKIIEALIKIQAQNIVIPKKRKIKILFKKQMRTVEYSYPSLDDILQIIKPILTSLDLLLYHQIENNKIVTTLHHKSGECIKSIIDIPEDLSPQEFGSYITYMKRYSITAMLCLSCDDDDDGSLAEKKLNLANNTKSYQTPAIKQDSPAKKSDNNIQQESYEFEFNGEIMNELQFIAEMKDCEKFPKYYDKEIGDFDELLLFIYCIDLIKNGKKDEVKDHTELMSEGNKAILREIYKDPNHRLLKLRV